MLEISKSQQGLCLSPVQVRDLAAQFGTPLFVVDENIFRSNIRTYKQSFANASKDSILIYAMKANSNLALLQIALQEGLVLDAASEGELRAAILAGAQPSQIHLHGSNKSISALKLALEIGISQIIIDNFEEIDHLSDLSVQDTTRFVLRLAPGVDPLTHEKISTGQADTKFGFNIADGSAMKALKRCLELNLQVIGFHCHIGSQLNDPQAQIDGGKTLAEFALHAWKELGFFTTYLNLGGGRGVSHSGSNAIVPINTYCERLVHSINQQLIGSPLNPVLAQEPGRSLVADAGVTIYEIGGVKRIQLEKGEKVYVSVDGGLSDNPRPGLYNADYDLAVVSKDPAKTFDGETVIATIAGSHCESDILFREKEVPIEVTAGDYTQVFSTGAYNLSMASNYNRFPKRAFVLLQSNGEPALIQRRESWESMFEDEIILPNLSL